MTAKSNGSTIETKILNLSQCMKPSKAHSNPKINDTVVLFDNTPNPHQFVSISEYERLNHKKSFTLLVRPLFVF